MTTNLLAEFEVVGALGHGQYSLVLRCSCKQPNTFVALKLISKHDITQQPSPCESANAVDPSLMGNHSSLLPLTEGTSLVSSSGIGALPLAASSAKRSSTRLKRVRTEYFVHQMLLREGHPFLVQVAAIGHTEHYLFFAMKEYRNGTLGQYLRSSHGQQQHLATAGARNAKTLSEEQSRFVCCEILQALEYLHYQGVVYRDLKPENILLDESFHAVLSDFDLCFCPMAHDDVSVMESQCPPSSSKPKHISERNSPRSSCGSTFSTNTDGNRSSEVHLSATASCTSSPSKQQRGSPALQLRGSPPPPPPPQPHHQRSTSFVGTVEYLSPDVVQDCPVTPQVDMWSLGMLLYEMLFGFTAFRGNDERDVLFKLNEYTAKGTSARIVFPVHPEISADAKDVLQKLLHPLAANRMSSEHFRKHPWVSKHLTSVQIQTLHNTVSPLKKDDEAGATHRPSVGSTQGFEKYLARRTSARPPSDATRHHPPPLPPSVEVNRNAVIVERVKSKLAGETIIATAAEDPGLTFFIPLHAHDGVDDGQAKRSPEEINGILQRRVLGASHSVSDERGLTASLWSRVLSIL